MTINLSTFWGEWDVVSGNTSATNQYEFWKGMVMSNGQVLSNQYEFFTYHNTTRYEWFRDLQSTYPEVYDEYTFYKNTNNPNIYDMRTFYEFGAQYLVPSVTPTPTPSNTETPTPTPTPTVTVTETPTNTPTFTPTPSSTPAPIPIFVAGAQPSGILGYSIDGNIWSASTNTIFQRVSEIIYDGTKFFAVGTPQPLSGNTIATSIDALTWTGVPNTGQPIFDGIDTIVWNGSKYVIGGRLNIDNAILMYSTDGITWSASTNGNSVFNGDVKSLTWNGSKFVVGATGSNMLGYSTDGITWSASTNGNSIFSSANSVVWNGSKFVAGGQGTNTLAYSNDGITWSASTNGNSIITNWVESLSWNETIFVAGGFGTNALAYSNDGITWSASTNGNSIFSGTGIVLSVSWNGNKFVAVGRYNDFDPQIAYSTDGITWTEATNTSSVFGTVGQLSAVGSQISIIPSGDPDAQAYLAAVVATGGTVTSDITTAVETLFTSLKSAGIYSKLDILMPMVGGTKDSCLINAITPTNDLYKWTEYGTTLTYNVSGITGNRNGVLQSNFVMTDLTNVDVTNSHFTMYLSKLNTNAGDGYLNGYLNTQELPYTAFNCATYGDNIYGGLIGDKNDGGSMPAETGMWLRNRESNTGYTQYISNVLKESVSFTATESSFEPSMNIALFTLYWRVFGSNNLYNGEIGDMTYSTVTIGGGLNSSERTDLNNIITTFNTTLGRP